MKKDPEQTAKMPGSSFADMFPITEADPPVGEIKIRSRPGRAKLRLGAIRKVDDDGK